MELFLIKGLDGSYLSDHDHKIGVFRTRCTAIQRIKSTWNAPTLWVGVYDDPRPWQVKHDERIAWNKKWKEEHPFDQWWPQHYIIVRMVEE